jgi:hypothetical protein
VNARRGLDARRYLLQDFSQDEIEQFERDYFATPEALEAVDAAEEQLIDEYLDGTLIGDDLERFDANYLASAAHHERVATARRLRAAGHASGRTRWSTARTLALAAAIVVAVGGTTWVIVRQTRQPRTEQTQAAATATVAPSPPHIFAIAISPATVRGASESPTLVVPADAGVIDLRLEGDGSSSSLASGRVVIRTADGKDAWQGPIHSSTTLPAGIVAHTEVPAARLTPNDYVITLFETGPTGAEIERFRYFLRVRR